MRGKTNKQTITTTTKTKKIPFETFAKVNRSTHRRKKVVMTRKRNSGPFILPSTMPQLTLCNSGLFTNGMASVALLNSTRDKRPKPPRGAVATGR